MKYIPYGTQSIDQSDIDAVTSVLQSDNLTQGPQVDKFEAEICEYTGANFAVLFNSASTALHATVLGLKQLKSIKCLVTSPNSFVATSNSALHAGIELAFVDLEERSGNLDVNLLLKCHNDITDKVLMPVHFSGAPVDCNEIQNAYDGKAIIVEDASHALGAIQKDGHKVGSCSSSTACIFSFHPVKMITMGEGGCVTTNDKNLYDKLKTIRSHGISKDEISFINTEHAFTNNKPNLWYYEMTNLGFNFRITDIQAALGSSQLKRINQFVEARRSIAYRYDECFKNSQYITPLNENLREQSSHHLYVLLIDFQRYGIERNDFMHSLRKLGIITQVHYIPIPLQPYYVELGYDVREYEKCLSYYKKAISIPCYPDLTEKDQYYVISCIKNILRENSSSL